MEHYAKGYTPTPSFTWIKDVNLSARRLGLHKYHISLEQDPRQFNRKESEDINILEELEKEQWIRLCDLDPKIHHGSPGMLISLHL